MYIKLILLILLVSCTEPNLTIPSEIFYYLLDDKKPPKITWVSPRFDEILLDSSLIECKAIDPVGVASIELYVDSMKVASIDSNTDITNFEFELMWNTTDFEDNTEHMLYIYALDNAGNDTISNRMRVIIDNSLSYPESVNLIQLDSLISIEIIQLDSLNSDSTRSDTIFHGYQMKWEKSNEDNFNRYILERSSTSYMLNSIEIFSAEDINNLEYLDNPQTTIGGWYYRVIIEDDFGRKTPGNVSSTIMDDLPPAWNISSIKYTSEEDVTVKWDTVYFSDYRLHKLLSSDNRLGNYDTLISFDNRDIVYYNAKYSDLEANWFSILTEDSTGQITISSPKIHGDPHEPEIDSIFYNDNKFIIRWIKEPSDDFSYYSIMYARGDNPYNLTEIDQIHNRNTDSFLIDGQDENEYFLFQIITQDFRGHSTRGPIVSTGSYNRFSTKYIQGNSDHFNSVVEDKNFGSYIAVGERVGEGGIVFGVNEFGVEEMSTLFSDVNDAGFTGIINSEDGGYFLAGYILTTDQGYNCWVIKINQFFALEWSKNFGNTFNDGANAIIAFDDGIGITGYSQTSLGNKDLYIVKMDYSGDIEWERTFGGEESDAGHTIISAEHNGMYILGETNFPDERDAEIWILELNSTGNLIDSIVFGGEGQQIGYSFAKSPDGSFAVGGITRGSNSGVTDALAVKFNTDFEVEWTFEYGGENPDYGYSIVYSDYGWVIAGQTYSYNNNGQEDSWIFKVSDSGTLEWSRVGGGSYRDGMNDIKNTEDGGFILCGSSAESGGGENGWIIKTDSRGNYKSLINYIP